ncbi:MAG: MMPL family transporter [Actinobacteria bacterium]|nr:MAG: MMPL family transporter [Actinomycetota bacterium]
MSPLKRSNNLAARMGRWSADHWKTAVFGWLAFVVVAFALGSIVGTKHLADSDQNVGQARTGDHILNDAGFQEDKKFGEFILIESSKYTTSDPQFKSAVAAATAVAYTTPTTSDVHSPYSPSYKAQIAKGGHAAYVSFNLNGESADAQKTVDGPMAKVKELAKSHPGFTIRESGDASAGKALDKLFGSQFAKASAISLPLTLGILLLVFGAVIAAGVPLVLAFSAVLGTTGLVALVSHLIPMDQSVSEVILLVGLAVGVDYSLFYVKREREEKAAGRGSRAALEAAAATSGRAVLISGFTVIIAMAGLFFSGDKTFFSFGIGTMLVVLTAMIGSLTVLPALLAKLGDRVEKGRLPYLHKWKTRNSEPRVWKALLRPVLKHPLIAAVASAGVLVALTIPAFGLHTSISGLDALPKSVSEVQTLNRVQELFPGGPQPAIVAIKAKSVDSPAVARSVNELVARANATPGMHNAQVLQISKDRTVAEVTVQLNGEGTDATSNKVLSTLRNDVLPNTVGKVAGVKYATTGMTAATADYNSLMKSHAPYVFGFVLLFAFLLLMVAFRSIVIPIKAILLNLLSVGAAYGVLVEVFQKGHGSNLLDFQSNGAITSWLPIFLFVILFGLSMDYHVFILSRIREAFDRGLKTGDAVEHGIVTTAGVVTSAAVVMVGAFGVFALMPIIDMKELGIGLAAAVLIDATIVRAVLLPATMKLLGDWNWYLPKWLEWLPRLEHEAPVRSADEPDLAQAA